jgi:hypothetical protein
MTRFNTSTTTFEFYNGTSWVGVGLLDGTSEATAAPSASAILIANPTAASGLYWIKPSGTSTAYRTFCDMQYDGGGWVMALAYYKGQTPIQDVNAGYFASPQIAANASSLTIDQVARTNDPLQSFCMPAGFWSAFGSTSQGRGEIREEYSISGGTWPSNSTRVVIWHGGRTSGGAAGNFLTSTQMTNARTVMGWSGRNSINYGAAVGSSTRGGYLSNTLGIPSRYSSDSTTDTVLGISVDASHLSFSATDGTNFYRNDGASSGSSWMGRGSGYGQAGSSLNPGEPNGTRWGFIFIR